MGFNKDFLREIGERIEKLKTLKKIDEGNVIRVLDYGAGNAWVMTILSEFLKELGYSLDYFAVDTSESIVVKLWERGIVTKTYDEVVQEDINSYDLVLLGNMDGLVTLDEVGTLLKLVKDKVGLVMWKTIPDFESFSDMLVFLS